MPIKENNVFQLPVSSEDEAVLEDLEAELTLAATRVRQALARRRAIIEKMTPIVKKHAEASLKKRGIHLGKTVVIASDKDWDGNWRYKRAIVMEVIVSPPSLTSWWADSEQEDEELISTDFKIRYELVPAKKDGTPSKASLGMYGAKIERVE